MSSRGLINSCLRAGRGAAALCSAWAGECAHLYQAKTGEAPVPAEAMQDLFRCGHACFFIRAVMQQLYQCLVQAGADGGALLGARDVADVDFDARGRWPQVHGWARLTRS